MLAPAQQVPDEAIPPADVVLELYELRHVLQLRPGDEARFVGRTVRTWGRVHEVDQGVVFLWPEVATEGWPRTCAAHVLAGTEALSHGDPVIAQGICRGLDADQVLVLRPCRLIRDVPRSDELPVRREQAHLVVQAEIAWLLGGQDAQANVPARSIEQITSRGWRSGPKLPPSRVPAAFVAAPDGTLWALGGRSGDEPSGAVERFAGGRWEPRTPLPFPWHDGGAAVLRGGILVAGGIGEEPLFGPPEWRRDVVWLAPDSHTWDSRARMPQPRRGGQLMVLDGQRAVWVGGQAPEGLATTAACYDAAADVWWEVPVPRGAARCGVAVVADNQLILAGPSETLLWDPLSGEVDRLPALPEPRWAPSVLSLPDGTALVVGGRLPDDDAPLGWTPSRSVDWVEVAAGAIIPQRPLEAARADARLALLDATVVVIGGVGPGKEVLRSIERRSLPSPVPFGGASMIASVMVVDEEE